ncbi:MAG TPA: efflux RND transporter periplasmic adaptor subunit, partial [Bacteroidales bacterium]|nr:efflux RND transporter periplasmic adaptor subunit [Bacteroidales bacterium]
MTLSKKIKRLVITGGILLTIVALIAFNRIASSRGKVSVFAEAKSDLFEISVSNSGELIAENSVEILGPQMVQGRRNMGWGGHNNMRMQDLKIQDIVPEGTMVREGDFIAQIDRTQYDNSLKDAMETLKKENETLEMKLLDSAVVLTNLRDDIKNQVYTVEEARITLEQSKFEPPATIRKAQIDLDRQIRTLEQKQKAYRLKIAQTKADIEHQNLHVSMAETTVQDLEDYLAQFTVKAPGHGMVIYKKDRLGNKRKAGSNINPWDLVIATLPDLSAMISKTFVNEIEISRVKKGQKAVISIDAFPDKQFTGTVLSLANIGEQLPNSDAKMFEVQIKIDGSDPALRPSMTTTNKIIIETFADAISIPSECVMAGTDSVPFVYLKNKSKQIVVLGKSNDKHVIVEKGLKPGQLVYTMPPEEPEKFRLNG